MCYMQISMQGWIIKVIQKKIYLRRLITLIRTGNVLVNGLKTHQIRNT